MKMSKSKIFAVISLLLSIVALWVTLNDQTLVGSVVMGFAINSFIIASKYSGGGSDIVASGLAGLVGVLVFLFSISRSDLIVKPVEVKASSVTADRKRIEDIVFTKGHSNPCVYLGHYGVGLVLTGADCTLLPEKIQVQKVLVK